MKNSVKYYLYIIMCLGFITMTSCSHDDPMKEEPTPVGPNKPDPVPDEPTLQSKIPGAWSQADNNYGGLMNVSSTSRVEFAKADSVTVNWYNVNNNTTPYSVAKGVYTVNGDSLKLVWKSVMTDSVPNTAFTTLYLAGKCTVTDNTMDYNYSVYDTTGDKLTGPHTLKFTKQQ